jgi:hypothetical protein
MQEGFFGVGNTGRGCPILVAFFATRVGTTAVCASRSCLTCGCGYINQKCRKSMLYTRSRDSRNSSPAGRRVTFSFKAGIEEMGTSSSPANGVGAGMACVLKAWTGEPGVSHRDAEKFQRRATSAIVLRFQFRSWGGVHATLPSASVPRHRAASSFITVAGINLRAKTSATDLAGRPLQLFPQRCCAFQFPLRRR